MRAKIINGTVEYFNQPSWILGDATDYSIENGYKQVIHITGPGGIYETETDIIIETPEPEPVIKTILAPLEFLTRFSQEELRAIFTAAKTSIDVEIWQIMFNKAASIDLSDPLTLQGVAMLEQLGLITPFRKEEILKPV